METSAHENLVEAINEAKRSGGDAVPIYSVFDYDGDTVPTGYEQVNSYSTTEVKTGDTWISGKPIYRKVLYGDYSTSGTSAFNINLSVGATVDKMIDCEGWHWTSDITYTRYKNKIGQPTVAGINYSSTMYFDSNTNNVVVSIDGKPTSSSVYCYVIVEYTKTTD